MSQERIYVLWARYLAGGAMTEEEKLCLLDILRGDAERRAQFVSEAEIDGLLDSLARANADGEAFVETFLELEANENGATRFVKSVEARLPRTAPVRTAVAAGRASSSLRPANRRAFRSYRPSRRNPCLIPAIAAAAVLMWVAVLIGVSSSQRAARRPERSDAAGLLREGAARPAPLEEPLGSPEKGAGIDEPVAMPPPQREEQREEREPGTREARHIADAPEEGRKTALPAAGAAGTPTDPGDRRTAQATDVAAAILERVEGEVWMRAGDVRRKALAGASLLEGDGLEIGSPGAAHVGYPDGTQLNVEAGSVVRDFKTDGGKRVRIEKGDLRARVAGQPKDRPMVFETPHGEALVLGTALRLRVEVGEPIDRVRGKQGSTRLDVTEGKARLKRLTDGKSLDVPSGHYAVAAAGVEWAVKALFAEVPRRGLELWLRAGAGVSADPKGTVSAWLDQSGGRHHAAQIEAARRPVLVEGPTLTTRAIRFAKGTSLDFALALQDWTAMTICVVCSPAADVPPGRGLVGAMLAWDEQAGAAWGMTYLGIFQSNVSFRFGTREVGNSPGYRRPASIGTSYSLTTITKDGPVESLVIDGELAMRNENRRAKLSGCPGPAHLGSDTVWGMRSLWEGEIAEILVYRRALSGAERAALERHLADSYRLTAR